MQRTIIISESQLSLLEKMVKENDLMLDNGEMEEYGNPDEVGTNNVVMTDQNGEKKGPGKPVTADEFGKETCYNGWFGNARSRYY